MEHLKELYRLIYGEDGIMDLVKTGHEEEVSNAQKIGLKSLAAETNVRIKQGEAEVTELVMYIDLLRCLISKSDIDWIQEMIAVITTIIPKGVEYPSEICMVKLAEKEDPFKAHLTDALQDGDFTYAQELYDEAFSQNAIGEEEVDEILHMAAQYGWLDFIKDRLEEVNLDEFDFDGYIEISEDPAVIDYLTRVASSRNLYHYNNDRFACYTWNMQMVFAFDDQFQYQVYLKFLEECGITEEELADILMEKDEMPEDMDFLSPECHTLPDSFAWEDHWDSNTYEYICSLLGVTKQNGQIVLDLADYYNGPAMIELLRHLGWECEYDGIGKPFSFDKESGVYYIR